jgi:hypothetical protein
LLANEALFASKLAPTEDRRAGKKEKRGQIYFPEGKIDLSPFFPQIPKEEPQPQVVVALGLLMTKRAP